MNRRVSLLSAAIGVSLVCAAFPAASAEFRTVGKPIEGRYIVVLNEDVAALENEPATNSQNARRPQVQEMARSMARGHGATLVRAYRNVLRGFAVQADDRALARLLADPRVAYVEEDGVVEASATQNNATWGIDRIDQRDLPLSGTYTYDTTASSVHAYVIDTGIRASHGDFGGRVSGGYTAINDGRGTDDCNGHGTHVAGTVGGSAWGVAKAVRLHPVRVLNCQGSGTNSGVIAGMDWVTSNHVKPAVANMSLGGGASSTIDNAVANMTNAGVTVAVAAGNDNANACNYSPARAASAITVGSTTSSDARSSFSNYGTCLDIYAPGSSITSAWHTSNTATNTISGTSMASPHVAGVAALYLAANPSATPTQVTNAIVNASTPNKVTDAKTGSPNRLLYSFFDGSQPPPPPPPDDDLDNGVPVGNLSASQGNWLHYTMTVPAGASNLKFVTSGGSGDADLYVKFGSQPTTSSYDCRPYLNGNNETCTFSSPQAGTYHVSLRAYTSFSGVTLTGSYDTGGGGSQTYTNGSNYTINDNSTVESPISVSGRSGSAGSSVPVAVDIKHTYIGDLKVDLVAPDGSVYVLHNRSGGSADNINKTYTVNLSSEALNGTWKLRVNDNYTYDTGYIDSWSVTF